MNYSINKTFHLKTPVTDNLFKMLEYFISKNGIDFRNNDIEIILSYDITHELKMEQRYVPTKESNIEYIDTFCGYRIRQLNDRKERNYVAFATVQRL